MDQDIGILLSKLNKLVANISANRTGIGVKGPWASSYGTNILGVSINVSTKVCNFDDSLRNNLKPSPPSPFIENSEPVIDVLESPENLKIVALLPGVRKEDVTFDLKDGMVELVIKKGYQIYRKIIPCQVRPTEIIAKSVNYNNSILEIIFKKKV